MTTETEKNEEIDYKSKYLYAAAELKNQETRFQREKEELVKYSQEKLIKEILTQLDSFSQALNFISDEGTRQGILYIKGNLEKSLEKFGLTRIIVEPKEVFNPHYHEAMEVTNEEGFESNQIVKEVQSGFTLHNKVIRASKVVVQK